MTKDEFVTEVKSSLTRYGSECRLWDFDYDLFVCHYLSKDAHRYYEDHKSELDEILVRFRILYK